MKNSMVTSCCSSMRQLEGLKNSRAHGASVFRGFSQTILIKLKAHLGLGIVSILALSATMLLTMANSSVAQMSDFSYGFESAPGTNDWSANIAVTSGTNGITAANGGFYGSIPSPASPSQFTRFGGYNSIWPCNGYKTSIKIYLDVAAGYANDTRLNYSSAVSNQAGGHLRDFIYHIGFYNSADITGPGAGTDRFIVGASNNSPGNPKGHASAFAISASGWYTLEHSFFNSGGVLSVDFIVYDDTDTQVGGTINITNTDNINTTVGGNRYGWMVTNAFSPLAVDDVTLTLNPGDLPTSSTDFESFATGTVNYQGPGCTIPWNGYTIPSPYGSLWTTGDEWGNLGSWDQEVKDDGTGNMVWRISNAVTSAGFANQPNSPSSLIVAGETGAALYNDRGPNHTTPVAPPGARYFASTNYWHGGFKFKSATGAAQPGLNMAINPAPRQGNVRMSFVGITDNGSTGFNLNFFETLIGGTFSSSIPIASDLSYADWHELDIYIEFVDGLNGDGSGNDIVTVLLNGSIIHVGTTWETFYASPSWTTTPSPIAVDALMFRVAGTAQPSVSGNGFYVDDVTYDNLPVPCPLTVHLYTDATETVLISDYCTIMDAVNAAVNGNAIRVDAGNYPEILNINKDLTINGPNAGISGDGTRSAEAVILDGKINILGSNTVTFDGFHVYQTNTATPFSLGGTTVATIQNNIIERFGVATGSTARGIEISNGSGVKNIKNNKFTGDTSGGLFGGHKTWNSGMFVNGPVSTINIEDNLFENCRTALNIDDMGAGISVSGNTFNNSGTFMSFGGTSPTSGSYIFGANEFGTLISTFINLSNVTSTFRLDITAGTYEGTSFSALPLATLQGIESTMYHRTRSGRLGLVYYVPNTQYVLSALNNNITTAIEYAASGDVINIQDGIYNQRLIVDKSLSLIGESEAGTILDGTGLGNGSGIRINNGIENVTIDQLTVINNTGAGPNSFAGIYAVGGNNNLIVQNTTLQDNVGGSGFYANGPITDVFLNNLDVSGHTNVAGAARGIVIWNGLKSNITITNCDVYNNNCCGIELQDGTATGITMSNNNIYDNGDNGIGLVGLEGPGENLISDNTLLNNGRYGIEIKNPNGSGATSGAGSVVVENNNVSRNTAIGDLRDIGGIVVIRRGVLPGNVDVPVGVVVQNNDVSGYVQTSTSEGFGIVVEGINHTVSGNTVSGCDVGVQRQAGHLPYPADGDQSNLADEYFGRGNSPITCGVAVVGNTLSNTIDERDVPASIATGGAVTNTNTSTVYCTIQSAIDAPSTLNGHVLEVSAGLFAENVVINKAITLNGANFDVACGSRGPESVIAPASGLPISITTDGVTINGFEITAPNNRYAISASQRGDIAIRFNNIHDIGTTVTGPNNAATVHSIYMNVGSSIKSNVSIDDNCFNQIASTALQSNSASAIGILDSGSSGSITNLSIQRNTISNVQVNNSDWPTGKIAYGILINVAGNANYATNTGNVIDAIIADNTISNLSGFIATAIGLEGNTENALVDGNMVSSLFGRKFANRAGGGYDLNGLKIENNRHVGTLTITNNIFEANTFVHDGIPNLGYAIANYVPSTPHGIPSVSCNWLGSSLMSVISDVDGANPLTDPPTGKVLNKSGAEFDFTPYLTSTSGPCVAYASFVYETTNVTSVESCQEVTVTVNLVISNTITNAELQLSFDTAELELVSAVAAHPMGPLFPFGPVDTSTPGIIQYAANTFGGYTPTGTETIPYLTLTFRGVETMSPVVAEVVPVLTGIGATQIVNFFGFDEFGFPLSLNVMSDAETLTVNVAPDTTVPTIIGTIAETTIEACSVTAAVTTVAALEALGLDISDICTADGDLVVTSDDDVVGTCPMVVTRTYTVTDASGNFSTTVQVINVDDTTVPVVITVDEALDASLQCSDAAGIATALAMAPTATDNCTASPTLNLVSDDTVNSCANSYVRTRVWNFTDDCGNTSANFTQVITVTDNTPPVIDCQPNPGTLYFNSGLLYSVVGAEFDPIVSDDCGSFTVTHDAISGGGIVAGADNISLAGWGFPVGGPYTITFTAEDACGNVSDCSITFSVTPQEVNVTAIINMACNVGAAVRIQVFPVGAVLNGDVVATFDAALDGSGQFTQSLTGVPSGNYDVVVKVERYLAKKISNVDFTSSTTSPNVSISSVIPGDIAGPGFADNIIGATDLSLLIFHYNTLLAGPNYNDRCDLNCDDKVDALDLSFLSFFYNTLGAAPWNN